MKSLVQRPVVEKKPHSPNDNETVSKHPAYGQIAAGRVTCSRGGRGGINLYGSDFQHHEFIKITISKSELNRSLSRDWAFAHSELIEVALSFSQWAEFVSTLNSGMGVQCTLQHIRGERIPELPAPEDTRTEQAIKEQTQRFADLVDKIKAAEVEVEALNISRKAKDTLLDVTYKLKQEFESNLAFAMRSFGEHTEDMVEKAKTEVNAYVENRIHSAGLDALKLAGGGDARPVITLPEKSDG